MYILILVIILIICCSLAIYFKKKMNSELKKIEKLLKKSKKKVELLFKLTKTTPDTIGIEYEVSVFTNGLVQYTGHKENAIKVNFREGYHEFNLSEDELETLRNLYDKINIEELEDLYECSQIKDNNGTNIITFGENSKEVNARCNYPEEISDLIAFIWSQLKLKIQD